MQRRFFFTTLRDATEIKQRMVQQEKERIAGIRARGEDQLWLSHLNLRQVISIQPTGCAVIPVVYVSLPPNEDRPDVCVCVCLCAYVGK